MTDPAAFATPVPTLTARQPRAIHSALTVLEAVATLGAGVSAREVSEALGLPRATTYRLLNLLVQDEYLVRTPDLSGFALGAKVAQLASAATPVRLPAAARAVLSQARDQLRGGVHVVRYGGGRLTVADADPDFPLSDDLRLVREPARYALGRLLLADLGRTDPVSLAAASDLRRLGATRQIGEIVPGLACLAVPVRDSTGELAAGVAFAGPRHRVEEPQAVLDLLRPVAERLAPLLA
ncbi:MAG: helix-turn-helix domain-containing protein [Microbacterium sp.]|uniref:IclR family transcriptional regulator n=1 Tax=Microbacterium sp. TaxID=51671 RepID=UPI00261C6E9F|nr:helix-turn-helix domain-containing protein [Microbacterium sp.]MCX6503412.1 helix-turn-helix domain-containing protein [Microbacterium sp.]